MKYYSTRIFIYLSMVLFRHSSTIKTPNENGTVFTGKVTTSTFDNKEYTTAQFLGIPYAKPPIGERRFSKPELLKLNDTYSATELKSVCHQKKNSKNQCLFGQMSEDCLFLNIYVPIPGKFSTVSTTQTSVVTDVHEKTEEQFTTTDEPTATIPITTTPTTTTPTTATPTTTTPTTTTPTTTTPTTTTPTTTTPTTTTPTTTTPTTTTPTTTTPTTTTPTTTPTTTTPTTTTPTTTTPTTTTPTTTTPTTTTPTTTTPTIIKIEPNTSDPTTSTPTASSADTLSNEERQEETINSDGSSDQEEGVYEVDATLPRNRKMAVFIYIHGGAYFEGNGNCYDGSKLASFGDIIVVTINYRLGPLGFLTTDDKVIPGNLGLWDQQLAIKWVKENIESFGGDPTRITVGGQSAGSFSSLLQALSPQNVGLFQRVIAQSGSPFAKNSVIQRGYKTALEVAKHLRCPAQSLGSSSTIKDCLMEINATDLVQADLPNLIPSSLPLEPTLDGDFITDDPHQKPPANSNSTFTDVDLLIGFDAEDGEVVYRLWALLNAKKFNITGTLNQPIPKNAVRQIVFEYLAESFEEDIESYKSIIDAVVDRYMDWERPGDADVISNRVADILTDVFFVLPVAETALAHSQDLEDVTPTPPHVNATVRRLRDVDNIGNNKSVADPRGKTYVYKFKLPKTDANFQNNWFPWFNGTNHGAEVKYVFGHVTAPEEIGLSSIVMKYWSNFIKNGNPNQVSEQVQTRDDAPLSAVEWPSFTKDQQSFLEISTQPTQRNHLGSAIRHFWYDLVPNLRKDMEARFEAGVKSGAKTQNGANQSQCNQGARSRLSVKTWLILSVAVLALFRR